MRVYHGTKGAHVVLKPTDNDNAVGFSVFTAMAMGVGGFSFWEGEICRGLQLGENSGQGSVEEREVFSEEANGCQGVEGGWSGFVGEGVGRKVVADVVSCTSVAGAVVGMEGDALGVESEDYVRD